MAWYLCTNMTSVVEYHFRIYKIRCHMWYWLNSHSALSWCGHQIKQFENMTYVFVCSPLPFLFSIENSNWLLIQTRSFIYFFIFFYHQYSTGKGFLRCLIRPLLPSSLQVRTTVWSLEGSSRITVLTGGGARIFRPCIPVFRCHRPERNEVYI